MAECKPDQKAINKKMNIYDVLNRMLQLYSLKLFPFLTSIACAIFIAIRLLNLTSVFLKLPLVTIVVSSHIEFDEIQLIVLCLNSVCHFRAIMHRANCRIQDLYYCCNGFATTSPLSNLRNSKPQSHVQLKWYLAFCLVFYLFPSVHDALQSHNQSHVLLQ